MDIVSILNDIQDNIIQLQQRLDELRVLDDQAANDILVTRQEAANLLGESLRQLDRDCNRYGLRKITTIHGVRLRKRDLLIHMGVIKGDIPTNDTSELDRIVQRARKT